METKTIRELRVFISGPEDVAEEKERAKEVCSKLNESLRPLRGIEIKSIEWKEDIVPNITGEGAQTVIDKQLEDYNYDVYLGIMWKRFGERMPNGLTPTESEFENALKRRIKTGRPAILFLFKSEIYFTKEDDEKKQFEEVQNFRERIKDLGFYGSFGNAENFSEKIETYLKKIVDNPDLFIKTTVPKEKYPEVTHYLPRKICQKKDYTPLWSSSLLRDIAHDTTEIISNFKRVTLLSDAGVGKTIELERVAWHLSNENNIFYPFLFRLNKYVNQNITELLPKDWEALPESKKVIILDGLDEIESKNSTDAIRHIELFSEQYPNTHILVSCRTNFYDSEKEQLSGTLSKFSSFVLLELGQKEIKGYIESELHQGAEDFNKEISNNRLYELLKIPFYLVNLVELFKKNTSLPKNKAEIFEQLLFKRIELDIEHFRTTTKELRKEVQRIVETLKRLALGMEVLGRNYITDDEYQQLINDRPLRDLIEHCTVWKKDETEELKWQFEHNNFQEFLAAKLLSSKSLSTVKKFMFFEPDYRKLIPLWSNTLSFLISIYDDHDLIPWIIENEPELAVKFERDKVEIETRIKIFKGIFKYYKKKRIWISYDKFNYDELARFGQSDEIVEFLLNEAEKATHYTTIGNSIGLLRHIQIPPSYQEQTRNILVKYATGNNFGDHLQSQSIMALADLGLNSLNVITKIKEATQNSDSEWVRYGLYYFLHNSDYLDDNINIFLDGIKYIKLDLSSERNRLINESIYLRIGIEKAKSPCAIMKILKHFTENPQDLSDITFEESISCIANNAAEAFNNEPDVFKEAMQFFEALVDGHLDKHIKQFMVFFDKTQKRLQVFNEYLNLEDDNIERWTILAYLTDENCAMEFVEKYENGDLKEDDVRTFQNYLAWKNFDMHSFFNELINARTNNKFPLPTQRDYTKERKERAQNDFNLLFDKQAFLNEIKLIYETEKKQSFTDREVTDVQHAHWDEKYFSDLAIDQLRKLAKEQSVTFEDVAEKVNKWIWDMFCIHNVYEKMNHDESIILNNKQKKWIEKWCSLNLNTVNFKTALKTKPNQSFSSSYVAIFLWYFLRKLRLKYPKEVLLNLISYDWIEGGQYVGIEYLEPLLRKREMALRVMQNLNEGIENDDVMENHLKYCKKHKITESFPYASNTIVNPNRGDKVKRTALDIVCELSQTMVNDLEKLLPQIQDDFRWEVVEKIVQKNSHTCQKYLLTLLKTDVEEDKLKSAYYLIELQDLEGLKYYVDWVKKHMQAPKTEHHDKSPLLFLRIVEAVPYLLDLLEVSYKPNFIKSSFDFFSNNILDALAAIALQSEDNYQRVRTSIEDFIKDKIDKIENINFLYAFIEKLEQRYYISKSEKMNIKDVIKKLEKISIR